MFSTNNPIYEKKILSQYRRLLEQKLGWGSSDNWSNQEYENLTDKIFEATKIALSVSTLKRVLGKVRYEGTFNKTTLNALAQYIEFENWNSFKQHIEIHRISIEEKPSVIQKKLGSSKKPLKVGSFFLWVFLILIALLFVYNDYTNDFDIQSLTTVKFENKKVTDNLPNSVIFNYDVSKIDADSFFIQQNWDPKRRQEISPENNTHTSIYYYPGHFNARLMANDKVLKKSKVFIKTKGWKGIIEHDPIPIYLSNKEIKKDAAIGISRETLKEKTGLNVFNDINTWFLNIRSFNGLNAGNFYFQTTLKNTSSVNMSLCRQVNVYILFDGGAFTIPLADKGCISSLFLSTGQRGIDGKENDLSKFGCDFREYQKLECKVKNKVITIILNDKPVFKENFAENLAEIVGIKISFEGTGEIKNVRLGEPGKKPVLNDEFN